MVYDLKNIGLSNDRVNDIKEKYEKLSQNLINKVTKKY